MDLYIRPTLPVFEKTATAEVSLPDDANAWPHEIMQELYKQVPYCADFDIDVSMDRVDAERGFGFGHILLASKTEAQSGASPEMMHSIGVNKVRVPVIIKERKLLPFDIIVTEDSKMLPLTEKRLRMALFRPQPFDVTSRTPGDQSMIGQLYPPYRQNSGGFGGGGMAMSAGMGKEGAAEKCPKCGSLEKCSCMGKAASAGAHPLNERIQTVLGLQQPPAPKKKLEHTKEAKSAPLVPNSSPIRQNSPSIKKMLPKLGSVLPALAGTILSADYVKFASVLSDAGLQEAYAQNGYATKESLETILSYEPQSVEKRATAISNVIRPDIVQVKKASRGYTVKTARHDMWEPRVYELDRGQVVKAFGEKVAFDTDVTGSATIASGSEGMRTPEPEVQKSHVVERGGMYKVRTDKGTEIVGYVFPNLTDLDGTVLPMALFTNGTVGALQAEIIGEPVAEAKNPPDGEPSAGGYGLYFRTKSDGELEVTVPMKALGMYQDPDGPKQMVETLEGAQVLVACQPHIQKITMANNTCLIPDDFKWMPLGALEEVSLESLPGEGEKQAHAMREFASVVIRSGGSDFSFSGFPVEKLAQSETQFLNVDDALFLLGGLGVSLPQAVEKMAEAALGSAPVQMRVGRLIKTADERMFHQMHATVKTSNFNSALRQDLFKEAAFIPDPMAVDTVLSLGFINPENLSTFVTYLPQMEQAQQRMCELLIAARLGLKTLDAGALEKAIKSLETSLDGLKVIAFQKN